MLKFEECIHECLENEDFVREFDRLAGTHIGGEVRTPMAVLVDQATGYDELKRKKDLQKFVAFVHETVWKYLPSESKDPTQVVTPPEGHSFEELFLEDA